MPRGFKWPQDLHEIVMDEMGRGIGPASILKDQDFQGTNLDPGKLSYHYNKYKDDPSSFVPAAPNYLKCPRRRPNPTGNETLPSENSSTRANIEGFIYSLL